MLKPLNRTTVDAPVRPVRVLQFGEGNFLRAFADWIIDRLNEETDFNGDIQIVQPLPSGMGDQINAQDGLYHVMLHGIQNGTPTRQSRLIKSVRGVINPFNDFSAYLKTAEEKTIRFIISNTTESGIVFSAKDEDSSTLATTFPGKLTQWLLHRFRHFSGAPDAGVIFLPCELIDKNGSELKKAILAYVDIWKIEGQFISWLENHCVFCNTLVDRIVPGYPKDNASELQNEIGFSDNLLVKAEPFHLWVIEGPEPIKELLPVHKTDLEVLFTSDLAPYRTRKVRILNGAHTSIVPVAYLRGLRTVQETVEHPEVSKILREIIFNEVIPTLELPAEELNKFASQVIERFQNPFIRHELMSIALNSISKFKVRVLPSLLEFVKRNGTLPKQLVNSLAMLILFYRGNYKGETIQLADAAEVIAFFQQAWTMEMSKMTETILANKELWGADLNEVPGLAKAIATTLTQVEA